MMHSGYEPSVVRQAGRRAKDIWDLVRWNLT
jgi:hypothetical protein